MVRDSVFAGPPVSPAVQTVGRGAAVYPDLSVPALYEQALGRGEGQLGGDGQLVIATGAHTGRSPDDKFVVRRPTSEDVWWGAINQPLPPAAFERLRGDVEAHLGRRERFIQHVAAGADPDYRLPVRLVTERASHALFARNLFLVPAPDGPDSGPGHADRASEVTILHAPGFAADPDRHGVDSGTAIALDLEQRAIVIVGTAYAGEIKKAVFTLLQYLLPQRGVATMHCSANAGADDDVALFFGLSGTGKTTLSNQPGRTLIGDDEHGWSEQGVFNFEGGCYAKLIGLSAAAEPEIYRASHRFGALLENVVLDPRSREPRLDDDSRTENTRAAFPLAFLDRASPDGVGGHPQTVVFLAADAFGVLPPVARLSPEQAIWWYLTGYTAKLAGTERGVDEPEATFSACFGAPFLPLPPLRYADLLGEKLHRHQPSLWLVNTGWSGGSFGAGERMPIAITRRIVGAILDGSLAAIPTETDPVFGLAVPAACPGVPEHLLRPRAAWTDPERYDRTAARLARALAANFATFAESVAPAVAAAGVRPRG